MTKRVMTVTGPVTPGELGLTLMHEHCTFAYPGWYADDSVAPYNRDEAERTCLEVLQKVKQWGVRTIVDATAADVGGRDPVLLKKLSEQTGIHIIAATGLFPERIGAGNYYRWQSEMRGRDLEEDLYELFTTELTTGIRGSGVKAGIIKVGTGDPVISDYEETVFKVAVRVAGEQGLSIITHTEGPTVGLAQQDLFLKLGADPARVMIGHQNNSDDIGYALAQLSKPGFYLGFDRTNPLMSPASENNILSLIQQGFADRVMLSHDCIFMWLGRPGTLPPQFADWNPEYIFRKLVPKMHAAGIGDAQIQNILVQNPRRFLGGL